MNTARKMSKYEAFSGRYFPIFGLNTEICGVNLQVQLKYGKIRTRKKSVFEFFYTVEVNVTLSLPRNSDS